MLTKSNESTLLAIEAMIKAASKDFSENLQTGSIHVRINFNKGGITNINKTEEMTIASI